MHAHVLCVVCFVLCVGGDVFLVTLTFSLLPVWYVQMVEDEELRKKRPLQLLNETGNRLLNLWYLPYPGEIARLFSAVGKTEDRLKALKVCNTDALGTFCGPRGLPSHSATYRGETPGVALGEGSPC